MQVSEEVTNFNYVLSFPRTFFYLLLDENCIDFIKNANLIIYFVGFIFKLVRLTSILINKRVYG